MSLLDLISEAGLDLAQMVMSAHLNKKNMYKIIKLNQTLPPNGVTVKPFFAPNDEKTLSMRFETCRRQQIIYLNCNKKLKYWTWLITILKRFNKKSPKFA